MPITVFLKSKYKSSLDFSRSDLDSSHTNVLRAVEQWSVKEIKAKNYHALYLTDRQGLPIAMSEPISGNHNDLFEIEVYFEEVKATLNDAEIAIDGLF